MKNKKIVIIVIILIIVAIAVVGIAVGLAFKDINARNTLTQEINSLSEDNINMEIVSKNEYGVIEKQVKEDCKLYFESIAKLRENYDKIAEIKVINIDNYQNDGPEFTNSLDTLNSIKTENQNLIAALTDLIDDAKIEERADVVGLTGKYKNLYIDIINQIKIKEGTNSAKERDSKFDAYLGSLIDVLSYMRDNKNDWFIENGALKSPNQNFIDEYNKKVQNTNIEL